MLVIGSRGSPLALWQAHHVSDLLLAGGFECRIEVIRTSGDRMQAASISAIGTKGLFTQEIEEAMLAGSVDLAVHSLKDLTTELPEGLCLAASPAREDARDALVGSTLHDLKPGARVGTGSVRRAAQLRALRPDVRILPIRGNVDTRLRKLASGEFDCILLAAAGLKRLGLAGHIAQQLSFQEMCPAPGQGALGIETALDGPGFEAAKILNHPETWAAVTAERAVLESLGGGCQLPAGAIAHLSGGRIRLTALVAACDGSHCIRDSAEGINPRELGLNLGRALLEQGGRRILDEVYADSR
ncbi:MAG: hydroxymethylbilane synthase [Acidobacteriota bacterium]|nr:hydroxymethylbilane synthase [Acidobacteriota bacterium]